MNTNQISSIVWSIIFRFIIPFFIGYSISNIIDNKDTVIIPKFTEKTIYYGIDGTYVLIEPGITIIGKK